MSLISNLREVMVNNKIDYYIVPTSDFHNSEYVSPYFKSREFLTGFTGSAGTLVVSTTTAWLWVDGRYFIQAEKQIDSKDINLMKIGTPNTPTIIEHLKNKVTKDEVIGFDGRLMTYSFVEKLKSSFDFELKLNTKLDLLNDIWPDRPKMPFSSIYYLDNVYTGMEYPEKLNKILEKMKENKCDIHILSTLEDQAWLYNLRGNDIKRTPVFLAYTVIDNKDVRLFIDSKKLTKDIKDYLKANKITVKSYDDFYHYISGINNKNILVDLDNINYESYINIKEKNNLINKPNPTILFKAIKNKTEINNMIEAQIKDSSAMIKFMYHLKTSSSKEEHTEISLAKLLETYRAKQEGFVDLSFDTICAFNEHSAIVHYSATEETNIPVTGNGLLLIDSGGHYLEGTTDITRTFGIGKINDEMKTSYTTVLKAHIALANAVFLKNTPSNVLDMLPRNELWKNRLNYRHGTGHGVGYLLSVHEGPNCFSYNREGICLEPGMITTNEPGLYIEGKFGIRLENEILCEMDETNEYGDFLRLQTISYVPFDSDCIKPSLLTKAEKDWLNDYHELVYKKISRTLSKPERDWLKELCAPIK